tara:strand:+ start:879 stop:1109 length:231 start_codon:yes stop_codon:yes gene_type:complete
MKRTYTYYEIKADIDGQTDTLWGSYSKADTVYEKQSETDSWRHEDGYKKIRIVTSQREEAPDPEVYPQNEYPHLYR